MSDTPPKLLGDGQLVVVTREGKRHQIDYKKAEQADFAALAAQLLDAISGPAAAAPPLPPAVMAPPPPPLPPAGWFPAPGREGWLRYWDGTAWTEHYHDPSLPPPV